MALVSKTDIYAAPAPAQDQTLDPRQQERQLLLNSLRAHRGYSVLLEVMQEICQASEKKLMELPPDSKDTIIALHNKAQAQWQLFQRMQNEVDAAHAAQNAGTVSQGVLTY